MKQVLSRVEAVDCSALAAISVGGVLDEARSHPGDGEDLHRIQRTANSVALHLPVRRQRKRTESSLRRLLRLSPFLLSP